MASGALARETLREFRDLKDARDEAERSVAKELHMVVLLALWKDARGDGGCCAPREGGM